MIKNNCFNLRKILPLAFLIPLSISITGCGYKYVHIPYCLNQAMVLFEDESSNLYFDCESNGTNNLCKYNYDDIRDNCDGIRFNVDNREFHFDTAVSNSNYLFANVTAPDRSLDTAVIVFDKSFSVFKTLLFKGYNDEIVFDLACSEHYLYLVIGNSLNNGFCSLIRYDYLLDTRTLLVDKIEKFGSYSDEDISLFFGILEKQPRKCVMKYSSKTRLLCLNGTYYTDKLKLNLSGSYFVINSKGKEYKFKKENQTNSIYKKVFLIDDKLLFATYKDVWNPQCGSENNTFGECICGMRESCLYSFDTTTNDFSLLGSYESGTFLIDYDLDECRYYYNGGLYINGSLVRNCKKIENNQLIKMDADEKVYTNPDYYVSYYNGEVHGI